MTSHQSRIITERYRAGNISDTVVLDHRPMERIGAVVAQRDGPFARFVALVLAGEAAYVFAVRAVLGEPPVPPVTVLFAVVVAAGLAAQEHRSRRLPRDPQDP